MAIFLPPCAGACKCGQLRQNGGFSAGFFEASGTRWRVTSKGRFPRSSWLWRLLSPESSRVDFCLRSLVSQTAACPLALPVPPSRWEAGCLWWDSGYSGEGRILRPGVRLRQTAALPLARLVEAGSRASRITVRRFASAPTRSPSMAVRARLDVRGIWATSKAWSSGQRDDRNDAAAPRSQAATTLMRGVLRERGFRLITISTSWSSTSSSRIG